MKTDYSIFELRRRADMFKPSEPKLTARDFSNWIYKLSHNPYFSHQPGAEVVAPRKSQSEPFWEADIPTIAQYISENKKDQAYKDGWNLVYADQGLGEDKILLASTLRIGDQVMRCRPDAVLCHEPTGEILILERKIMSSWKLEGQIPSDSYPNIRAQLWCYSKIDDWSSAPKITLMDEIWRRNAISDVVSPPKNRRIWDQQNFLISQFEELFMKYCGLN